MTVQPKPLGGRYELGEVLGYGGMAEVRRGRDMRLGRDVAVKLLRADLARDQTFQTRFRREAQNAASLNHPSIVAVYDTGEDAVDGSTVPYIVMEFVAGRTLKEVLEGEGRLHPRRACEIVADVCAALDFSHRHQIIHRDVKPGNVMSTSDGKVKVMDFGIARAMAAGQSTMTQTSAVIGTAQYLSPEQARGESVDARSDVYATGCLLYELLTGQPPFTGDNPVSVAYQHVRELPQPPSTLNPDIPPAVDAIAMTALAKNPIHRYQTAGEMREDLERAIAGRPVLASPPPPAASNTQVMDAPPPRRQPPPPEKHTGRKVAAALIALTLLAGLGFGAWWFLRDTGPNQVEVPDVLTMEQATAIAEIKDAGLRAVVTEEETEDADAVGTVLDQDPAGETFADENSEVKLVVATSPGVATVPELTGPTTCGAVEDELEDAGLTADCTEEDSAEPTGTIISMEPEAGEELERGEVVEVVLSGGGLASVPDVNGDSVETACARLEDKGLTCEVNWVEGDGQAVGTVVSHDPSGDAPSGSTITLEAVGVEVPDLVDMTVAEARSHLNDNGIDLALDAGDAEEGWTIVSQSQSEGGYVEPGSTIQVQAEDEDIIDP